MMFYYRTNVFHCCFGDFISPSPDLNAKGCVHQAFEMYRLKSCIDFKPYEGEKTFIKFEKKGGYDSYLCLVILGQMLLIANVLLC